MAIWLRRDYRWGAIVLTKFDPFLFGVEKAFMTDSWNLHLGPLKMRFHREYFAEQWRRVKRWLKTKYKLLLWR